MDGAATLANGMLTRQILYILSLNFIRGFLLLEGAPSAVAALVLRLYTYISSIRSANSAIDGFWKRSRRGISIFNRLRYARIKCLNNELSLKY